MTDHTAPSDPPSSRRSASVPAWAILVALLVVEALILALGWPRPE